MGRRSMGEAVAAGNHPRQGAHGLKRRLEGHLAYFQTLLSGKFP
jgi:hypothetical protein